MDQVGVGSSDKVMSTEAARIKTLMFVAHKHVLLLDSKSWWFF